MRRLLAYAVVTIFLFGCALAALTNSAVGASDDNDLIKGYEAWVLRYGVATAATIDPGYIKASSAFDEALAKRDKKAVADLLNDDFKWVEWNGVQHTKSQVLQDLDGFVKANSSEDSIDVRTTDFRGDAERLLGIHHNMRFAHLWTRGPAGWQAFAYLDIPIAPQRRVDADPPAPPKNPDAPCPNPCESVGDFKPADAPQAQVLKNWMELKNSEWHPNPEVWSSHADIYHETISPGGDIPLLQHVAELANARRLYGALGAGPGVPVLQMKMFTFGNVVVQENLQGPLGAVKPAEWNIRLFVNRGDSAKSDWKICMSAQTRIK